MVRQMCKLAGITGHKTNHSLRATASTCLFHAGIDEQLIMERTGYRSIEGVRSYKRTSEEQVEELSDVLNMGMPPRKRQKFDRAATNAHQVTSISLGALVTELTCSVVPSVATSTS